MDNFGRKRSKATWVQLKQALKCLNVAYLLTEDDDESEDIHELMANLRKIIEANAKTRKRK